MHWKRPSWLLESSTVFYGRAGHPQVRRRPSRQGPVCRTTRHGLISGQRPDIARCDLVGRRIEAFQEIRARNIERRRKQGYAFVLCAGHDVGRIAFRRIPARRDAIHRSRRSCSGDCRACRRRIWYRSTRLSPLLEFHRVGRRIALAARIMSERGLHIALMIAADLRDDITGGCRHRPHGLRCTTAPSCVPDPFSLPARCVFLRLQWIAAATIRIRPRRALFGVLDIGLRKELPIGIRTGLRDLRSDVGWQFGRATGGQTCRSRSLNEMRNST